MFRGKFFFIKRRNGPCQGFLPFIIFVIIAWGVFFFVEFQMSPNVTAIAEARAQILATEAINNAVKEKIVNRIQYKDLITIHKDATGQITLIQVNTIDINRLETETALEVTKTLENLSTQGISIPIGTLTRSKILANRGPAIKVLLQPMGTVRVNTIEAFESAGINQTRHRIVFEITAKVKVVQPLMSTDITVKTDVPIAETIVIGNVPQALLNWN